MKRIVVICTGNTCRSPMAEGIIKKLLTELKIDDTIVSSMGLSAFEGEYASESTIEALEEIGVDMSNHRSKGIIAEEVIEADKIYVMTNNHKVVLQHIFAKHDLSGKIVVLNIDDPFQLSVSKYRECRDKMYTFFKKELLAFASSNS